jgi:hypothetical protein
VYCSPDPEREAFLAGPQKLGTGGTLILVWNRYRGPWPRAFPPRSPKARDRGHPHLGLESLPGTVATRHPHLGLESLPGTVATRHPHLGLESLSGTVATRHPFILGWSDLGTRLNTPAFLWAYGPPADVLNWE